MCVMRKTWECCGHLVAWTRRHSQLSHSVLNLSLNQKLKTIYVCLKPKLLSIAFKIEWESAVVHIHRFISNQNLKNVETSSGRRKLSFWFSVYYFFVVFSQIKYPEIPANKIYLLFTCHFGAEEQMPNNAFNHFFMRYFNAHCATPNV